MILKITSVGEQTQSQNWQRGLSCSQKSSSIKVGLIKDFWPFLKFNELYS